MNILKIYLIIVDIILVLIKLAAIKVYGQNAGLAVEEIGLVQVLYILYMLCKLNIFKGCK